MQHEVRWVPLNSWFILSSPRSTLQTDSSAVFFELDHVHLFVDNILKGESSFVRNVENNCKNVVHPGLLYLFETNPVSLYTEVCILSHSVCI